MAKKKTATAPTLFGYSIFHPLNLILLMNCIVFLMQLSENLTMTYLFALTPNLFLSGSYWQIFTYGFLHSTYFDIIPFHILMNMYGLYMLGKWKSNRQNGKGVLTNANGDSYNGHFKDDQPEGEGIHTKADGSIIFKGQWTKGKPVK